MSSYLSNLLTSTTDRYNSLRRNLLTSEGDGDTEDDSHISRVLRAYYTEKNRALPDWLPPDPRKVAASPVVQTSTVGSSYGGSLWQTNNNQPQNMGSAQPNNASRSALSDLWDTPASNQRMASPPVSLRGAGRSPNPPQQQQQQQPQQYLQANPRPLPSQRAGSYQSQMSARRQDGTTGGGDWGGQQQSGGNSGGGGTAQERLKARLYGQAGRSGSPAYGSR